MWDVFVPSVKLFVYFSDLFFQTAPCDGLFLSRWNTDVCPLHLCQIIVPLFMIYDNPTAARPPADRPSIPFTYLLIWIQRSSACFS